MEKNAQLIISFHFFNFNDFEEIKSSFSKWCPIYDIHCEFDKKLSSSENINSFNESIIGDGVDFLFCTKDKIENKFSNHKIPIEKNLKKIFNFNQNITFNEAWLKNEYYVKIKLLKEKNSLICILFIVKKPSNPETSESELLHFYYLYPIMIGNF